MIEKYAVTDVSKELINPVLDDCIQKDKLAAKKRQKAAPEEKRRQQSRMDAKAQFDANKGALDA